MSRWPSKPLSEICEINPRLGTTHGVGDNQNVSFVPMAAVDETSGRIFDRQVRAFADVKKGYTHFRNQDVLFAKITPCMENGKAAIASDLIGGVGFGSTEFHVLRASEAVLPEWLFYFVRQPRFRSEAKANFTGTAGQQRVPAAFMAAAAVPVPPLNEQRGLVDLLSRAEGIVRLRREAEQKTIELIPALFLEMFGNPASNPKKWPIRKVADFVSRFEGGKNIQAGSDNGSPYRILKVSAVTSGIYRETESKTAPDGYAPPASHIVRVGDMLFSRANTEELVGATAIVRSSNGTSLLPDKLWRFVWAEPVETEYMHALFQSRHVRRALGKLSSGTSASMRNISQAKLFGLSLPVAPLENQRRFAEAAQQVRAIQTQQTAATENARATFDALLARAFKPAAC